MGFEALKKEWTEHVMTLATERFERRLAVEMSQLRVEISQHRTELGREFHDGLADVRRELANTRVEIIRWSFLFWVGQITAIAAMLTYMFRALER